MLKNKWAYTFVALLISFSLFEIANFSSYSAYKTSMDKVQTIELNMLAHMLPIKLSSLLISENLSEIKETLKSNYGVFGLVLTDCTQSEGKCENERVIYANRNQSDSYIKNKLWQESFDLLRSPAPLVAEQSITDYHLRVFKKLNHKNTGNVIGRIYYISSTTESFAGSQVYWVKKIAFRDHNDRYSYTNNLFILVFSLSLFALAYFGRRHRENSIATQAKLEQEVLRQKEEILTEENKRLVVENELLKAKEEFFVIESFNKILSNQIEHDFSPVVANQLQHLQSIRRNIVLRINAETDDIIHDLTKAPILRIKKEKSYAISDLSQFNKLMRDLDESIIKIQWAIDELRQMTTLESEVFNLKTLTQEFLKNPPYDIQNTGDLNIELIINQDVFIRANKNHIRSIIKNALYNAADALETKKLSSEDQSFKAKIQIKIVAELQHAVIEIVDNGNGIPEEYIDKLYKSFGKLNTSQGVFRGNGSLIVAAYLLLHQGDVQKENLSPSCGAKIKFLFPLVQADGINFEDKNGTYFNR